MPVARVRLQSGGRHCWLRGLGTALPLVVEHLIDHAGDLVDAGLVEMRRQQRGEVFLDALAAYFMDGFGARPDEDLLELFLAAVVIARQGDFGRVLGERAQRLESFGQARLKAAADFAGPAHVERLFFYVEPYARLFALEALHFFDGVDFKVIKPRTQRVLDLRQVHAFAQECGAVNMNFHAHFLLRIHTSSP